MIQAHLFALMVIVSTLLLGCTPKQTRILQAPYWDEPLATAHNFVPIDEGRLYSSALPSRAFLQWLINAKGVRTLISLRGALPSELQEIAREQQLSVYEFHWSASRVPPQEELHAVFMLMHTASLERPALVFCKAGVDRTGYARAYYRYFGQGWSATQALREFNGLFHLPNVLDDDLKRKFSDPQERPPLVSRDGKQ